MTIEEKIINLTILQKKQFNKIEDKIEKLRLKSFDNILKDLLKYKNQWVKLSCTNATSLIVKYEEVGTSEIECLLINLNDYSVSFTLVELQDVVKLRAISKIELGFLKEEIIKHQLEYLNKII